MHPQCHAAEGRSGLIGYGALPKIRTKLARTLACVSISVASSVAKSGTSAARASSRSSPAPAVLASNGPGQAQPQDLREILIELHRRAQHFGLLDRQHAQRPGLVEHARGRGVENAGQRCAHARAANTAR